MVPFPLAFDSARSVLAVKGHASVARIGLKCDTVHDTFMALSSRTKPLRRFHERDDPSGLKQNKYYVGEKKGPGATTCFDTGNTV